MQIKVIRQHLNENCTLGEMLVNGEHFAWTLEDTFRDLQGRCELKVKGQTCIDNGTYTVVMAWSAKHKRMVPHIQNVPCFDQIEIHAGNTEVDTLGCILIGANTDHKASVSSCAEVVNDLYELIEGANECTIELVIG